MAKQHSNVSLLHHWFFKTEANTNYTLRLAPHQLADLEPAAWPAFNSLPTLDDYLSSSDQVQRDQARFYRKPSLSEPPHQSHLLPQPFEHSQNTLFDHTLDQRQPTSLALQRPSQRSSAQIPNQPTLHRFGGISSASPTSTENHILNAETLVAQALKKITTTACEALIKATPQIIDEVSPTPFSFTTFISPLTECLFTGVKKSTRYFANPLSSNDIADHEREETRPFLPREW